MTRTRLRAILIAVAADALLAACAPKPAKPPAAPPSVTVQYEAVPPAPPKPAPPPALPAFWQNRADLIQAPPPPPAAELALPKVERFQLKNGVDVVVVARKDLPVVSFSLAVKAGGYDEQKGRTQGVADFTAAMLRRGTDKRSADDISAAIDYVGGSLDAQAGGESSSASCSALSKDAKLCLDLLADILIHPTFPESEMGEVRDQMLASVAAVYDNPHELASEHFDNQLYGEKHPDGWVLTPEDVQKITRADLITFWKTYYRPNNAILAVAGDVDPAKMRAMLNKAFGAWERAPIPERPAFKVPEASGTRILLVDRPDLTQATVMFGHKGIKHSDPAWYAATVVNYVLGGSDFSSRLMAEVRSKRGLTYGITSSFGASLYESAFRVSASTKNESAWEALTAAVDELRRMKAEGPTPVELAKAKGYFAGSTPFALQTPASVAGSIVAAELHGLGIDYVRDLAVRLAAVDEAAAKRAAADLLLPDTLTVVIVGKADVIEPQIAKSGIPYERINFKDPISRAERARLRKQRNPPAAP
jgi:zinc protease